MPLLHPVRKAPKPLTRDYVAQFVKLDPIDPSILVWAERDPRLFNTVDPEKTARGFNRKMVGRPCYVSPNGTVKFADKQHSARVLLRLLGGTVIEKPRAVPVRLPATVGIPARRNPLGHCPVPDDILRKLFRVSQSTGGVVWRARDPELVGWLTDLEAEYLDERGRRQRRYRRTASWSMTGMKVFNARFVGKPVATTPSGHVKLGEMLIEVEHVMAALGIGRWVFAPVKHRDKRVASQKVTDDLIVALIEYDEAMLVWKPRRAAEWRAMVAAGVMRKLPEDVVARNWNAAYGGAHVEEGATLDGRVAIGNVKVPINRVREVVLMATLRG